MPGPSRCAFCEILAFCREAYRVLEDETSLAFLDHRPLFAGHCLLVPKKHYATFAELPKEIVAPLFLSTRLLARAVEEAMGAEGTFVAMNNRVSQGVPHVHVHVVPRRQGDGLRGFFWPRTTYTSHEAMRAVQASIRSAVERQAAGEEP